MGAACCHCGAERAAAAADVENVMCAVVGEADGGSSGEFIRDEGGVRVANAGSCAIYWRAGRLIINVCLWAAGVLEGVNEEKVQFFPSWGLRGEGRARIELRGKRLCLKIAMLWG